MHAKPLLNLKIKRHFIHLRRIHIRTFGIGTSNAFDQDNISFLLYVVDTGWEFSMIGDL